MAPPIIDSVSATPSTVEPGQSFVVVITASDPDARSATLTGQVTDSVGNIVSQDVVVTISDPLAYELIDVNGEGFQIAQRASQPNVFDCVAPAG